MLEQELKLTARSESELTHILTSPIITRRLYQPPVPPRQFLAQYHDTAERDFQSVECTLRSRREGELFRAAFKEKGEIRDGLSVRTELECDIDSWLESVADLPPGQLKERVLEIIPASAKLINLVTVDMQRSIYNLEIDGTQIECVADVGTISANGKTIYLNELELELKSGNLLEIIELGNKIKSKYDVVPSELTKHQLGLQLWD